MWRRIEAHSNAWDMIVVGGGATGVGVAIDAASRGYDVLLLEQSDFGKGTSSRSTKLAHGGVRYLEQGNIGLVMEALKERGSFYRTRPPCMILGSSCRTMTGGRLPSVSD
jgi:glycerol-3-phosphate dehydrogenase